MRLLRTSVFVTGLMILFSTFVFADPKVTAIRCPNGGVQPQAVIDSTGKIHLVYLKGDEGKSDIDYVTSTDGGKNWSAPLRVNSVPGSAIAVGTVRGAHLALGKNNRPHVGWMGSSVATPKGPNDASPMLYTRLNDAGDAFEAQRNVISKAPGLDGGASIAADSIGGVYVAWHAPIPGRKGEMNRSVWLAYSRDDGKTFGEERSVVSEATGACGCCGMKIFSLDHDDLVVLYRGVNETNRAMYLLTCQDTGFRNTKLQDWPTKTCPMSTSSVAHTGKKTVAAWETDGQVNMTALDESLKPGEPIAPTGKGVGRKHPSVAINSDGYVLLAWAEGTGWKKGGNLAWQLFDPALKPVDKQGMQRGLAVWSLGTAVALADGSFVIVY